MCVVLCLIYQRSHYIVSVALAGFPKSFPSLSLSLSMTLSNKCSCIRNRHVDKLSSTVGKKATPKRTQLDPYIYIYIHISVYIHICVFGLMPKWA